MFMILSMRHTLATIFSVRREREYDGSRRASSTSVKSRSVL
jgi:hypothetical protein